MLKLISRKLQAPWWQVAAFHSSPLRRAVKEVRQLGDPCLRKPAEIVSESEFGTPELKELAQDLLDTMRATNGAGIAAPQIGVSKSMFIVEGSGANPRYPYKPKIPLTVFVNPEVEVLDETPMDLIEGCLSVPGFRGKVTRACKVRVRARNVDGTSFQVLCEGHAAGTMQHEDDHLHATLFTDQAGLIKHGLMTWEAFERYQKEEYFAHCKAINERYPKAIVFEEH